LKYIVKFIATVGFIGFIPFASGTFGSLVGVAIWVVLSSWKFYPLLVLLMIAIGIIASDYAEKKIFHRDDPSEVVIDEVAGMLVSYMFFKFTFDNKSLLILILGFAIFRFFDILKPQPIKVIQKLPGGIGIMIDDIVSGIYTCLILSFIGYLFKIKMIFF